MDKMVMQWGCFSEQVLSVIMVEKAAWEQKES
jgi:hypothetical protein